MPSMIDGYFIYRDTDPEEPFDPLAKLHFCPANGTRQLEKALAAKYPNVQTHSERMRDAVIEYLLQEKLADEARSQKGIAAPSPWQTFQPTASSACSSSAFNSPETLNLATPSCDGSFISQTPLLTRESSTATSAAPSGRPSPNGLEQMTSCFSLSTAEQPKQRVRRRMTEAEKIDYRKRRIVKACDKCAKRKRKCQHNQPEMETVTSRKPAAKRTTKTPSNPTRTAPANLSPNLLETQHQAHLPSQDFGNDFMFDFGMSDFTMFDDQLAGFNFDDLLDLERLENPYPFQNTAPATLTPQSSNDQLQFYQARNRDTVRHRDHFGRPEQSAWTQSPAFEQLQVAHAGDATSPQAAGVPARRALGSMASHGVGAGAAPHGRAEGPSWTQQQHASLALQARAERGGVKGTSGAHSHNAPLGPRAHTPGVGVEVAGWANGGNGPLAPPAGVAGHGDGTRAFVPQGLEVRRLQRGAMAPIVNALLAVCKTAGLAERQTTVPQTPRFAPRAPQVQVSKSSSWTTLIAKATLMATAALVAFCMLPCLLPTEHLSVPLFALLAITSASKPTSSPFSSGVPEAANFHRTKDGPQEAAWRSLGDAVSRTRSRSNERLTARPASDRTEPFRQRASWNSIGQTACW